MSEEFDLKENPFNPRINEIFEDYAMRMMKAKIEGEYECHRCGDCCTWYFYHLDADQNVAEKLRELERFPHGYWLIEGDKLALTMPIVKDKKTFRFTGPLPKKYLEFHYVTNRMHGYWVLNEGDKIACYAVEPCKHLKQNKSCGIYMKRPEICQDYYCGRYPMESK